MRVAPSQAVTIDFRVKGSGGLLVDADSLPTAALYRNGASTAVVVTVASITGTGKYSAAWTNAGYTAGDQLRVEVTAVVSAATYVGAVWEGTVDAVANTTTPLDAAGVRAAVGLAAADLDTQLGAIASASGTGARTVTATVTVSAVALEGAVVRLTLGAETYTATTNASGVATLNVDDGTYTVAISKSGYSFTGTTLVVDGDETVAYSMTSHIASVPSAAGLAVVYAFIRLNDAAVEGATLQARLVNQNSATSGVLLTNTIDTATTDANGYAELELVQLPQFTAGDGKYVITAKDAAGNTLWSIASTIPAENTVSVQSLLS